MAGRFGGKVALVTGAESGIGLATATRLAEEGAVVVAGILDESQRPAVAAFDAQVLDVRAEAGWQRVLGHLEAAHGGLDVLVNSAGIYRRGGAEATDATLWREIMAVNLWGTFLGCREAMPLLRRRGGGAIVNLASIAGIRGVPDQVAYCASKGGVVALTLALAVDHAADGIRVTCVCPGAIDTPILAPVFAAAPDPEALREAVAARHPMGRMGRAEEIAAAIAFLASPDASFTTGVALPVDGGRSAR